MTNEELSAFCAEKKNQNLIKLNLSRTHTAVTDLKPLVGLVNLKYLNLNNTSVTDLQPLAGLLNLIRLDLTATAVTDLAPLAGLVKLEILHLDGTAITDLQPLAGLVNLEELDLDGCPIPYAVHGCGSSNRTICFRNQGGQIVANLGCRMGTKDVLIAAIKEDYDGEARDIYIAQVEEAHEKYLDYFKNKS